MARVWDCQCAKLLLKNLEGTIDVDSKLGEGTIVSIVLAKCSVDQDKDHENVTQY